MISEYLLINILTIIFPLLLSFEKKLRFYRNFLPLLVSFIIVGGTYIIWDVIATYRGDWGFNPDYITGFKIINLPLEEILFFITVPYSGIFLYETGKYYLSEKKIRIGKKTVYFFSAFLIISGFLFIDQYYTLTVLIFSGLFLLIAQLINSRLNILNSSIYWLWILFMYLPFLIVNYFLTSLPIVTYSPAAIWGIRITTIPMEDFFYSFSMLSFYLLVYLIAKDKCLKKEK